MDRSNYITSYTTVSSSSSSNIAVTNSNENYFYLYLTSISCLLTKSSSIWMPILNSFSQCKFTEVSSTQQKIFTNNNNSNAFEIIKPSCYQKITSAPGAHASAEAP